MSASRILIKIFWVVLAGFFFATGLVSIATGAVVYSWLNTGDYQTSYLMGTVSLVLSFAFIAFAWQFDQIIIVFSDSEKVCLERGK